MSFSETPTAEPPPGFLRALSAFRTAAARVPAYKDFLSRHSVDAERIQSPSDFALVPPTTKENYLRQYPLRDLLLDGNFSEARVISMSSGSSGKPFYWSRGTTATQDGIAMHETLFDQTYGTREKETLCIVAFSMGTWIAGSYTLQSLQGLAEKGHRITSITPGINKAEVSRILKELSPMFEQTVICGYPPFVKDALDETRDAGVDLAALNIKLLFAGENFSESWRDYVLRRIGKQSDPFFSSANVYGTADAGMLGFETPFSIFLRRQALYTPENFKDLFPNPSSPPTLVTYDPERRYFEQLDETLAFTVENVLPLIRYNILDNARLVSGHHLLDTVLEGTELPENLRPWTDRPYIALYGREDVVATFYALNIYPENIRGGLEQSTLQHAVTGKFITEVKYDPTDQQQSLHLTVELKPGTEATPELAETVLREVVRSLRTLNSEYNKLNKEMGPVTLPYIHLAPYESEGFSYSIKHRWVTR